MVDANGNVINPQFLPIPDTTSTISFASALHVFTNSDSATGCRVRLVSLRRSP